MFWIFCFISEECLPRSFYQNLQTQFIDYTITESILAVKYPLISESLRVNDYKINILMQKLYSTLFTRVGNDQLQLTIFDYLFVDGVLALYKTFIIMLQLFFESRMGKPRKKLGNSEGRHEDSLESFNDQLLKFMSDYFEIVIFKKKYQEFYLNESLVLAIRKDEVEKMRDGNERYFDGHDKPCKFG